MDFSLFGEPHDQGLVFKWGSLVGIEMPTIGVNETPFRGAADVVFRPAGFTGTITDDWATVPYCATDFAPYDNTATDHLIAVHNPVAGLGDICRYMGVIDSANWRMPTAAEWAELYGSDQINGMPAVIHGNFNSGSFTPLSGYAFGAHQSNVRIVSDAEVANADPYDDGALFLPASGFRDWDNGAINWIGSTGYCWASTASSISNVYHIWFNSTTVGPQDFNRRNHAWSIRCIRE